VGIVSHRLAGALPVHCTRITEEVLADVKQWIEESKKGVNKL
jgi:hypothetical protein